MIKKDKNKKIDLKETYPYSDIRQSLKTRETFIVKTFDLILNREPSSRELSYYKYGDMEEVEISEELLSGEEHKEVLKDAKEKKKLEKKVKALENEKERLENLINDKAVEYRELASLLQTKNQEIKKLREEEKNIYNQEKILKTESVEEILPGYSFEYNQSYSQPTVTPKKVSLKREEDIFDKIRKLLKIE